jgi:hypothetical protein
VVAVVVRRLAKQQGRLADPALVAECARIGAARLEELARAAGIAGGERKPTEGVDRPARALAIAGLTHDRGGRLEVAPGTVEPAQGEVDVAERQQGDALADGVAERDAHRQGVRIASASGDVVALALGELSPARERTRARDRRRSPGRPPERVAEPALALLEVAAQ